MSGEQGQERERKEGDEEQFFSLHNQNHDVDFCCAGNQIWALSMLAK